MKKRLATVAVAAVVAAAVAEAAAKEKPEEAAIVRTTRPISVTATLMISQCQ